ncbi:MAG: succinate dehydrogenase, cytochrome b556 subunit [Porticoccaceae bacterium]
MNDKRPVNLDIPTIQLPITAYVSILHRVSGVALFAVAGLMLWMLDESLRSEESFNGLKAILASGWCKLVLWTMLSAVAYHLVAGIRHLIMDLGVGETLKGGVLGARLVLVVTAVLIALAGVWIWQ